MVASGDHGVSPGQVEVTGGDCLSIRTTNHAYSLGRLPPRASPLKCLPDESLQCIPEPSNYSSPFSEHGQSLLFMQH